jgi:glycosyltransferase involved in cell wall biosynthesis
MIGVSGKTYCIHNGITPTALTPRHSAELSIVTIAELTKNKGLSYALGAIALLARDPNIPQFSYTLYGEGEERGTLERFIAERNLGHIVHLAGFVENAPARLAEADIFLLPSLKEGLPYAVLEAGAAGIAVVATAVGGMSDIIDDMKTGMLIRPKREREIADALRFLLTNHAKRTALAQALRDKIARYFSFEKMLSATQSVYGKFGKNLLIAAPCS